ncbi:hypothetical protein [Streptococcus sp. S784/96/1]|uniref:hypothetical protein n=1 Tax=Streptococcus sp. S784/96/1 TaxID=2653499 RepID=UPI001386EE2B|nr:hypothetical protein [Streptococcus sp. S784/96/1]
MFYIDETGIDTSLYRKNGRAKREQKVYSTLVTDDLNGWISIVVDQIDSVLLPT